MLKRLALMLSIVFLFSGFMIVDPFSTNITSGYFAEGKGAYYLDIEMTDFDKKDFTIKIDQDFLIIEAKKGKGKDERYFSRAINLPKDAIADKVTAKADDGILRIEVKKSTTAPKVKNIEIN